MKLDNDIKRAFFWNTVGNLLSAFQSVIILMVLSRVGNLVDVGMFTIAYANANLFLTVGKYGVRNFQVSDVSNEFHYKEYEIHRYITVFLMVISSMAYVGIVSNIENYYPRKRRFNTKRG